MPDRSEVLIMPEKGEWKKTRFVKSKIRTSLRYHVAVPKMTLISVICRKN